MYCIIYVGVTWSHNLYCKRLTLGPTSDSCSDLEACDLGRCPSARSRGRGRMARKLPCPVPWRTRSWCYGGCHQQIAGLDPVSAGGKGWWPTALQPHWQLHGNLQQEISMSDRVSGGWYQKVESCSSQQYLDINGMVLVFNFFFFFTQVGLSCIEGGKSL